MIYEYEISLFFNKISKLFNQYTHTHWAFRTLRVLSALINERVNDKNVNEI